MNAAEAQSVHCPGGWPIDYLDGNRITHGELACTRRRDHIGLCEAPDPDTGQMFKFPGRTERRP